MSVFPARRLRLVEFNVENLFVRMDLYQGQDLALMNEKEWRRVSSSTIPNKPLEHLRWIARTIREIDPDILMLCEVGGRESLSNFSRYFLSGAYDPHLIEGNSDRGIDIGYLVKKDLPFQYDLISHRHRSIDFLYEHERLSKESGYGHLKSAKRESHRFSRDVLELRVYSSVEAPQAGDAPVFVILLVHLKSQLDRDRIDPGGRDRRKAELEKLIKIYHEISAEFHGRVPIFLAGDFNGVAALADTDPEFEALYRETTLRDVLEIAKVSEEERFTFQQLQIRKPGVNKQFDYIFVPHELAPRVNAHESWVYRYTDAHGMTMVIPRNLHEKRLLPSDHYPVILTLNASSSASVSSNGDG